ncbi:ion channel [Egicoccus sp. AB-alg2]|uniref:ion channel n=1 Tax=Egicoccus sp. AB-alg2 TaxID=3242693 RepID=UPI00359DAD57
MESLSVARALVRGLVVGGLGFAVLAVAPLPSGPLGPLDAVLVTGGVLLLGMAVAAAALREQRAARATDPTVVQGARIESLVAIVLWAVAFFALAYARLAEVPGQFSGLATRLDAAYFTISTLVTVGFGDVHAAGQTARLVVTVQMVFNTVVIAAAVRVLLAAARRRAAPRDG